MHLAGVNRQIDPLQDLLAVHGGMQVLDLEHSVSVILVTLVLLFLGQPTLPSREMPTSFWASTANSMGSCCSTSRQKPLTTRATASSSGMPR